MKAFPEVLQNEPAFSCTASCSTREFGGWGQGAGHEFRTLTEPIISVQPGASRPFYVIGEVKGAGEFTYRQGMTVLSAISAAGGYTYRAKEGEVEIVRNINGKQARMRASEDTPILPGDRIRVYERWF